MAPLSRMEWIEKIDFPKLPFALKLCSKKCVFWSISKRRKKTVWMGIGCIGCLTKKWICTNTAGWQRISLSLFQSFSSISRLHHPRERRLGCTWATEFPETRAVGCDASFFLLVPTEKHGLVFADGKCLFILITFLFIHKKTCFHLGLN